MVHLFTLLYISRGSVLYIVSLMRRTSKEVNICKTNGVKHDCSRTNLRENNTNKIC